MVMVAVSVGLADASRNFDAPEPAFVSLHGRSFVVVEGRRHRLRNSADVMLMPFGMLMAVVGFGSGQPWVRVAGLAIASLGMPLLVRVATLTRHDAAFSLSPVGVTCDAVPIPWTSIRNVQKRHMWGPRTQSWNGPTEGLFRASKQRWNLVCLELTKFDGVRGMTALRQGLANLNQSHRVILAEAGELRNPARTVDVLEALLANPSLRARLDKQAGADLARFGLS